jgi:hypothetical protein
MKIVLAIGILALVVAPPPLPGNSEWLLGSRWADTPIPEPTRKVCHLCDEDVASPAATATPLPVAHLWLFYSSHCSDCTVVMKEILPAIRETYAAGQVVVHERDLEKGSYEMMQALESIHEPQVGGIPKIFIGSQMLVGEKAIRDRLPSLIDEYLASGGVDLAAIPALPTPTPAVGPAEGAPDVHLAYFTVFDCQPCSMLEPALRSLAQQHPQLVIHTFSVSGSPELLARLCNQAGIKVSACIVPAVFVGQEGLAGPELGANAVTDLVARYLASGAPVTWEDEPAAAQDPTNPFARAGLGWVPLVLAFGVVIGVVVWWLIGKKRAAANGDD